MSYTSARKVVSGLVLLGVGVLVTYWKGDIPSNLQGLMQTLYMAFVAGNACEHVSNAVLNKKKEENNE